MNTKNILTNVLAFTALMLPVAVFANGGDVHTPAEAATHKAGASSLVLPGTPVWWGLIAVSLLLMSLLSIWVYKYIQVAPVKKMMPEEKK